MNNFNSAFAILIIEVYIIYRILVVFYVFCVCVDFTVINDELIAI